MIQKVILCSVLIIVFYVEISVSIDNVPIDEGVCQNVLDACVDVSKSKPEYWYIRNLLSRNEIYDIMNRLEELIVRSKSIYENIDKSDIYGRLEQSNEQVRDLSKKNMYSKLSDDDSRIFFIDACVETYDSTLAVIESLRNNPNSLSEIIGFYYVDTESCYKCMDKIDDLQGPEIVYSHYFSYADAQEVKWDFSEVRFKIMPHVKSYLHIAEMLTEELELVK